MKRLALHRWLVLLATIAFAMSAVAQSDSPVGSWFGKLHGAESGTAFLSFNSDQTLTGLGYSHRNAVPFAIHGTWSVGQNGEIRAELAQITSGISRPAVAVAMAREGHRLTLKAAGAQGEFSLHARPAGDVSAALAQPTALASGTTSNACTDQCNLNYSTCLYQALAGRNFCMTRCSMTLYPKKCYPGCRSYYSQATRNCDATNKVCLAACPP